MPTLGTPLPVGVTDAEKAALAGSVGTPGAGNKYVTEDDTRANSAAVTTEPNGFPNITDSTLAFVPATRTFTIAPAVTSFDTYSKGVKQTYSSAQNVVIPNTTGLHFIYFNAAGTLVTSLTPWTFGDGLVFVATIYWNANVTTQYILGEERHGLVMDWRTHQYLHETRRTVYVTGFGLSGFTLDSDTDADVQFGVANGQIDDEDLRHFIVHAASPSNPFEQILTDPAEIPVYHRSGVGGPWVVDAATTFPFKNTVGGTGRINYNSESGGTWGQTEVANNNYVAYWLFASNDPNEPIISIQGQREDNDLVASRANNGFNTLNLGGLPSVEWKVLYRLIYQTGNGLGGTRNAKLKAVDDFRTAALQPGEAAAVTEHSSLAGLPVGDDHPQYQLRSEKSQPNGYASLDASGEVPITEWPTAAPVQGIGAGNTEGTGLALARNDHDHTIRESGGQDLTTGAIADGEFVKRSGTTLAGSNPVVVKSAGTNVANTPHNALNFIDGLAAVDAGGGQSNVAGGLVKTDFAERTADTSYTGATYADLLTMTYAKVRADTALIISACASTTTSDNDRYMRFRLVVDGTPVCGWATNGKADEGQTGSAFHKLTGLATGNRAIALQWLTEGGTTMWCRPATFIHESAHIMVQEVRV
jgi:hypothetical protein